MEILLDDYKRKLESLKALVPNNVQKTNSIDIDALIKAEKLITKIYEYKAFIIDIERAIERENKELEITKAKSDRESAIEWWNRLSLSFKAEICYANKELIGGFDHLASTGREIEILWRNYYS